MFFNLNCLLKGKFPKVCVRVCAHLTFYFVGPIKVLDLEDIFKKRGHFIIERRFFLELQHS